jgi:HEAT repeat protein
MTDSRAWDESLARSRAAEWDVRERAAQDLGRYVDDQQVRDRLQELLDDENTAVGEVAARQLVLHGGPGGLAIVADAWAYGDEDSAQDIGDALLDLRMEGFPVDSAMRTLIATAPDDRAREAARDVARHLGVD